MRKTLRFGFLNIWGEDEKEMSMKRKGEEKEILTEAVQERKNWK